MIKKLIFIIVVSLVVLIAVCMMGMVIHTNYVSYKFTDSNCLTNSAKLFCQEHNSIYDDKIFIDFDGKDDKSFYCITDDKRTRDVYRFTKQELKECGF